MSTRGKFITLEGGEGTGKSTLITGLAKALRAQGKEIVTTREPGGTVLAEQIRSLALTPPDDQSWSPLAHALLMNTARDDHLRKLIRPALARGAWVLCDRFSDSTRAYQSVDGVARETLLMIESAVLSDTIPDLTFILDGDPKALLDRRQSRGTRDVFEDKDMAFHDQIRQAFLSIAHETPDRCIIIDAEQSPNDVLEDAMAAYCRGIAGHMTAAFPLLGHAQPTARFLKARASNRLHHGWIFQGPSGIGKSIFAKRIAGLMLGADAVDSSDDDKVMQLVKSGGHPDLKWVERGLNEKGKLRQGHHGRSGP